MPDRTRRPTTTPDDASGTNRAVPNSQAAFVQMLQGMSYEDQMAAIQPAMPVMFSCGPAVQFQDRSANGELPRFGDGLELAHPIGPDGAPMNDVNCDLYPANEECGTAALENFSKRGGFCQGQPAFEGITGFEVEARRPSGWTREAEPQARLRRPERSCKLTAASVTERQRPV